MAANTLSAVSSKIAALFAAKAGIYPICLFSDEIDSPEAAPLRHLRPGNDPVLGDCDREGH